MDRDAKELLRRLSIDDHPSLKTLLALTPSPDGEVATPGALSPRVRSLVRLGALVAVDASTTSIQWAAEAASVAGADDDQIVGVLVTVGPEIGSARMVSGAPRLALAIGQDVEVDGWDGS